MIPIEKIIEEEKKLNWDHQTSRPKDGGQGTDETAGQLFFDPIVRKTMDLKKSCAAVNQEKLADIGNFGTASQSPLSKIDKITAIETHFNAILHVLGIDISESSLSKTPRRIAEMYVNELFEGLDPDLFPEITVQENTFEYQGMILEKNISIYSICEHHFIPFIGHCHIAYRPNQKIIGLSKLNRITQYYARRPQIQERLTVQIKNTLSEILEIEDVAVVIDAIHLCVRMRGIQDHNASTRTFSLGGVFLSSPLRNEFFQSIPTSA